MTGSNQPERDVVRQLWAAFQARDWNGARALLQDDLVATWWTSGERFFGADGFIRAQSDYPEGWTIRLIECERLDQGRILSVVRVNRPPRHFYATSLFTLNKGKIAALDEYWATAEEPPVWREAAALPGRVRFAALDDPRAVAA